MVDIYLEDYVTYEDTCGLCEFYMTAGRFCLRKSQEVRILDRCGEFKRRKVRL